MQCVVQRFFRSFLAAVSGFDGEFVAFDVSKCFYVRLAAGTNVLPGDASWNERGNYVSWRMMLRGKRVVLGFAIKDKITSAVVDGNLNRYINPEQHDKLGRDPEIWRRIDGENSYLYPSCGSSRIVYRTRATKQRNPKNQCRRIVVDMEPLDRS